MSVVHKATLIPSKDELVASWLDRQAWADGGDATRVGSYRFDDPAGDVGIEGMIVRRGDQLLHIPMTYRAAPLPGAEQALIGTLEHSVLGQRWVYDAIADPVAVAVFSAALRSEVEPELLEVYDRGVLVERKESPVQVRVEAGDPAVVAGADVATADAVGRRLGLVRVIGDDVGGRSRLVATWSDGEAAVAALA